MLGCSWRCRYCSGRSATFTRACKAPCQQFVDRGIVGEAARPQFDAAIRALQRLRESRLAEVLLLVLVYAVGIAVIWRHIVSLDVET